MTDWVYMPTWGDRLVNVLLAGLIRVGVKVPHTYLLTVRGRKSGKTYTNPVTLLEENGQRWLVAPYGEVGWVRNARASGEITLTRGRKVEMLGVRELPPEVRGPVLKAYLNNSPTVLPHFDAKPDSPVEVFAAEGDRHPVFLLVQT